MIIRQATVEDAAGVAAVMNQVIGEGQFTLFDRPFSVDDERSFLASLGARSAVFVAQDDDGIVGVQSLDLYSSLATSMSHVATLGTWLSPQARGRGIGRRLAAESLRFAELCGYRKIVIQVLGGNERALRFYTTLGFTRVGIMREHVVLNGAFHDEVLMEKHLPPAR
jgi:RimJ/RimL family protein N-acetyltransferase